MLVYVKINYTQLTLHTYNVTNIVEIPIDNVVTFLRIFLFYAFIRLLLQYNISLLFLLLLHTFKNVLLRHTIFLFFSYTIK